MFILHSKNIVPISWRFLLSLELISGILYRVTSLMEFNRAFYEYEINATFKEKDFLLPKEKWFFMSSIWPVLALTSAYLYFVVHAGPRFMKNRKPMSLKSSMLLYNFIQVVFSSWLVIKGIKDTYGIFLKASCTPSLLRPQTSYEVDCLAWYYMMSKYVEFLDTVFFILRGKTNQVTFLHVYHHANMAVFTWVFVKYISGIQILMIGLSNSFVHAAMYGYYFLAALGPTMNRYLWWKRYLTRLQIVQFIAIISFTVYLYLEECNTPMNYIIFCICNTSSFLFLFLIFYAKSYSNKRKVE